jgi:hypothetical protein
LFVAINQEANGNVEHAALLLSFVGDALAAKAQFLRNLQALQDIPSWSRQCDSQKGELEWLK